MAKLQAEHVLVVHSEDGLDEMSIAAPTYVAELVNGTVQTFTIMPETFGLQRAPLELIRVNSVAESVAFVRGVLDNQTTTAAQQAARDIVLLNAGAAIYAANLVDSLTTGVELAQEMLSSGLAKQKLAELVALTQTFK
jgi:anthranilate phosphoribosyltransferase